MNGLGEVVSVKDSYAQADAAVINRMKMMAFQSERKREEAKTSLYTQVAEGKLTMEDLPDALISVGAIDDAFKIKAERRAEEGALRAEKKVEFEKDSAALKFVQDIAPGISNEVEFNAANEAVRKQFGGEDNAFGNSFEEFSPSLWGDEAEATGAVMKALNQYENIRDQYGDKHSRTKTALRTLVDADKKQKLTAELQRVALAQARKTLAATDKPDPTTLAKLESEGEALQERLSKSTDPEEQKSIQKQIHNNKQKILKVISITGTTKEDLNRFGYGPKAIAELKAEQTDTLHYRKEVAGFIEIIEQHPGAITAGGSIAGFISNLVADVNGLAEAAGVTIDWTSDDRVTNDTFRMLSNVHAELQTRYLSVALAYAKAAGIGKGRELSNEDLKRVMIAVGAGESHKDRAQIKLRESLRFVMDRYKVKHLNMLGEEYKFDLTPRGEVEAEIAKRKAAGTWTDG